MFKVKTCQPFFQTYPSCTLFGNFLWSCALITSWSIHHRQEKSCAKMKTWSIVHHRQLQSAFSAAVSLVQRWGWAGDRPRRDEGGNCKRAKLSFAAGDQTEPFFWMIIWIPSLFSIIIFLIIRPSTSSDPSDQQKAKKVVRWQQPHSQVQVQVDFFL